MVFYFREGKDNNNEIKALENKAKVLERQRDLALESARHWKSASTLFKAQRDSSITNADRIAYSREQDDKELRKEVASIDGRNVGQHYEFLSNFNKD